MPAQGDTYQRLDLDVIDPETNEEMYMHVDGRDGSTWVDINKSLEFRLASSIIKVEEMTKEILKQTEQITLLSDWNVKLERMLSMCTCSNPLNKVGAF